MSSHVPLCMHQRTSKFVGLVQLDIGKRAVVGMAGEFDDLDAYTPLQLKLTLPQKRELPWWLTTYLWLCSGVHVESEPVPSVVWDIDTHPVLCTVPALDFSRWELDLPFIPVAIPLQDVCGYLPVHIVVQQGSNEYARYIVQRRSHCTQYMH